MIQNIVIGGNHHNTLGLIRSLGFKGVYSEVLLYGGGKNPFVGKSKYIQKLKLFRDVSEIADYLVNNSNWSNSDTVIIYSCTDLVAAMLAQIATQLPDNYHIMGVAGDYQILLHYMDKTIMMDMAKAYGIVSPKTWSIDKTKTITEIEFPCITKPQRSIDGTKNDIEICLSTKDLINAQKKCSCEHFIVQQYIDKSFEYQLIGCATTGGGNCSVCCKMYSPMSCNEYRIFRNNTNDWI